DDGASNIFSWWLRVGDNGPGIPEAELAQIFEPFRRGQTQRRFPQGMGLGLTIARDLVAAHGGEIQVVNLPEQGVQFTARLPV
ncbi:MAG: ATP-binding protein, partial [Caldilineaceae bacterium]|nr:ATP-binding protein [Caldilineaceae bacterium]